MLESSATVADAVELGKLAALRVLVGGTAHEINNPLTAAVGLADLLELDLAGTPHAARIALIREMCLGISAPVEALVAYARDSDAGMSVVELDAVVRDAVALWRTVSAARHVELVEGHAAEPLRVVGNPYQLKQLAVLGLVWLQKAMPGSGQIALTTREAGGCAALDLIGEPAELPALERGNFDIRAAAAACDAIAGAHGGEFEFELGERSIALRLRLPLAR